MKVNIDWLRDFVAIESDVDVLAEDLTMAGLEVDSVNGVAADLEGIIVAEILERRQHPSADKLSICRVNDGRDELEIVCGAPNAAPGLKVPFAPVKAKLPGGSRIEAAEIRGVISNGMLCSARELMIAEDAEGLLVLDDSARPGQTLRDYLRLDDHVLDIDLTPNRGDCFSVLGIAREIAARQHKDPIDESQACVEPTSETIHPVELLDTTACPRFAGRVISGLRPDAKTPDWLKERLRRVGLRSIHPVVDVTNYVMLELGQPLHAYSLDKLAGPIQVRFANRQESLTLLDGTELELDADALVIADDSGAIGLAGIMGGLSTAVDASTDTIFLESAFFAPKAIQGRARRYGLHTDASLRFERGVDPSGQERAVERATELLCEIAGGQVGPLLVAEDPASIPKREPVNLKADRVRSVLGTGISPDEIQSMLNRLGMELEATTDGFLVTPPSYRFDIAIEEDLIEELGRMVGYDRIPVEPAKASVRLGKAPERLVGNDTVADFLAARGYTEIVSYGFTDAETQARITGSDSMVPLTNPISQDLAVMRTSLWPGLLRTARLNFSHQIDRCRLFEIGTVFHPADSNVNEETRIAGLVGGSRTPTNWEGTSSPADFFDLKGDVEGLLSFWRMDTAVGFVSASHPALNPARSAAITHGDGRVGWIGELHPALDAKFEFKHPIVLFELVLDRLGDASIPTFETFSKFPTSRRDLAVVIDDAVTAADLTKHVIETLGSSLQRYEIFDLYRGEGIGKGRKSIGIGLILQDASRTLNDADTDAMIQQVVRHLERELGATIRNN